LFKHLKIIILEYNKNRFLTFFLKETKMKYITETKQKYSAQEVPEFFLKEFAKLHHIIIHQPNKENNSETNVKH